jgi:hypothetical protein
MLPTPLLAETIRWERRDFCRKFETRRGIGPNVRTWISIIAMEGRVCAIANPANCEEKYLQFVWDGSINQCMMAAEPYIAQWIGQHPEWIAMRWTCDYPGDNKKRRI